MTPERRFPSAFSFVLALILAGTTAHAATCCVWRVTTTSAPCYLVGTIHALSGSDYPLPRGYNQALKDSQRLVFEITPDPKSDFSRKLFRAAAYPKGDDIRRHVHPKTWEVLSANYKASRLFG
jgi:uncharacterized protein YbaP (TraB family)